MKQDIIDSFEIYKESIFSINYDINFWKSFLKLSIERFPEKVERNLFTAIFCAYDHDSNTIQGTLKCHEKVYKTNISDLEKKRIEFFQWIMNLSILKSYNSLEILIHRSIQLAFYPKLPNPIMGKKQTENIQNQIRDFLTNKNVSIITKNNDYLMQFLRIKSSKLASFLDLPMNTDLNTTWIEFFYLISILRNIIAHCNMVIQLDIQNEIKSKAKDVFERFFEIKPNMNGLPTLSPIVDQFENFITYLNSLSLSIYKYVFNENDLSFIGLK